jgi:hypothetical protein
MNQVICDGLPECQGLDILVEPADLSKLLSNSDTGSLHVLCWWLECLDLPETRTTFRLDSGSRVAIDNMLDSQTSCALFF